VGLVPPLCGGTRIFATFEIMENRERVRMDMSIMRIIMHAYAKACIKCNQKRKLKPKPKGGNHKAKVTKKPKQNTGQKGVCVPHVWKCEGRAHNRADGKGKYQNYECTECAKHQPETICVENSIMQNFKFQKKI